MHTPDIFDFNSTTGSHPAGVFVPVELATNISQTQPEVFSVYPSPANEEINISFVKAEHNSVALRNVAGEILYSAENYSAQAKIDVSLLPKGVYFVEIKQDNGKK